MTALVLLLCACAGAHPRSDGGEADAGLPDATHDPDVGVDSGSNDAGVDVDAGSPEIVVELSVRVGSDAIPLEGATWRLVGADGLATTGPTDEAGRASVTCPAESAPCQLLVQAPELGRPFAIADLTRSVSAHVVGGVPAPEPMPSGRELVVEVSGAEAGERAALGGTNICAGDTWDLGSNPMRVGFRWCDPMRPVDLVTWVYTPRMVDGWVRLPPGSGTPRTIAIARGLSAEMAPDVLPVDVSDGPAPRRVPLHIAVSASGGWRPVGPIDYVTWPPMDPQFTETAEGFDGTLAIFDEPLAAPGPIEIGSYEHWRARIPRLMDFAIPSADGTPLLEGSTVMEAVVSVPPNAWSQLAVAIAQRRADGTRVLLEWCALPSERSLPVVPPGVDLAALGFDPAGEDVFVSAELHALLATSNDLELVPRYYVRSSDLSSSRMMPLR